MTVFGSTVGDITPTVKKHQAFLNCQKLINCYVITMSRTQKKIYESCCGSPENENFVKDGFFNLNRIEDHRSICMHFAKSCERSSTTNVEELIKSWSNLVQCLTRDFPKSRETIHASRSFVYFIIGFCLLEAKVLFYFIFLTLF